MKRRPNSEGTSGPWYAEGLRFRCTQCGKCCTGEPGTVLVSDEEIRTLARRVELEEQQFRTAFTRQIPSGKVILRELSNGDCVFWKAGQGCTVYEDRPRQCKTWPFWSSNLTTPEAWNEASRDCPGMDQGEAHAADAIDLLRRNDGTLSGADLD